MDEEYTIDLREVFDIILTNIRTIATVTAIVVLITLVALFFQKPVYKSESLLRVKNQKSLGLASFAGLPDSMSPMTDRSINTYIAILKSRSVVNPVMTEMLENDSDVALPYEVWLNKYVNASPYKDTDILKVNVTAETPERAQKINEMLLTNFLGKIVSLNRTENEATRLFLEDRVTSSRKELSKAEKALQDYCAKHKIVSVDETNRALAAKTVDLMKQLAINEVDAKTAEVKLASINEQLKSSGHSIANSVVIERYNAELAEQETLRISYMERYTEKHPRMQQVNKNIEELKKKIEEEISRVAEFKAPGVNTVHQELIAEKFRSEGIIAVCKAKTAVLKRQISLNDKEIEKIPAIEGGFIKYSRKASVASELYLMLVKRLEAAKIEEIMVPNDVQIIDSPTLPDKHEPMGRARKIIVIFMLSVIISSAFVVVRDLLNKTIKTKDDIENYLNLPVWGVIPLESEDFEKIDNDEKKSLVYKIRRLLWKI